MNMKKTKLKIPDEVTHAWESAREVRKRAYAPYSKFKVGATVIDESGRHFHGCNVENASYGATICAERNGILSAVAAGAETLKHIVVVTEMNPPAVPCALCLQVIGEFATEETRIWLCDLKDVREVLKFKDLLPRHFGPKSLARGLGTKSK
jgi:homotetrameric cytidine deaminase